MLKKGKVSTSTKIYFVVLVIVSSLIGWLSFRYLNAQRETIFLYAADYDEGTPISGDMFVQSEIDISLYNTAASQGGKYASVEDIRTFIENGDVLKIPVSAGTPMIVTQTLSGSGTAMENRLGKYMTSVELDPELVSGLNSDIGIGSRINLISTFGSETSADGVSTKYADFAFQNLLVLDVRKDETGVLLGVSVEVEPSESLRLVHSMNYEKLTATVLKRGSYVEVPANEASYAKKYTEDPTVRTFNTGYANQQQTISGSADQETLAGVENLPLEPAE